MLGNGRHLCNPLTTAISLTQSGSFPLRVHTGLKFSLSVEFTVAAIVGVSAWREFEKVIRVCLVSNILLFQLFLLFFFVDFGFDINELVATSPFEALSRSTGLKVVSNSSW